MTAPALAAYEQGVGSVDADGLNTFEQTCDTVAELRAFIGLPGIQVFVRGLVSAGDGGAGTFYWVEGGTAEDDAVNVIVPDGATGIWLRLATLITTTQTILSGTSVDLTTAASMVFVAKSTGSPTALNLPADPIPNQPIVIIDAKGDAVSNPITVSGNGHTINGASTSTINTAYGNKKYVYNADLPVPAWITW